MPVFDMLGVSRMIVYFCSNSMAAAAIRVAQWMSTSICTELPWLNISDKGHNHTGYAAHAQDAAHGEVEPQQHLGIPSRQRTMMRMMNGDSLHRRACYIMS